MNPTLTDFHKILFLDLMPWQTRDWPAAKFKELNHNLAPTLPQIQPFFKVEFDKALSPKRIYFNSIIDSASNKYLNEIFQIHGSIKDEREYKYWAHNELTKTLAAKLNETEETISKMNLHLEKLSPSLKSQSEDPNQQDEIFIIQTLKHHLIRLYMEVQEVFKGHLPEPFKTEEEIQQTFFSELPPPNSFIKKAEKFNLPSPISKTSSKSVAMEFKIKSMDFRTEKKGVLPYVTVIKDRVRFSQVEAELFAHDLIDENYIFRNKHGQIRVLSGIYQMLINKGYFLKRQFPKNIKIKPVDIRKFLDHRYKADTDKQFRIWGNSPDKLEEFVASQYWIDKILHC